MKKIEEKITYSIRNRDGNEVVAVKDLPSAYFALHVLDGDLFVHKVVSDWHSQAKDCGTVYSSVKKESFYVYCDDVKDRDFDSKPTEMASNGYSESEHDSYEAALIKARKMAERACLDDDYLVYVEKIVCALDEDGDVVDETYETIETVDSVKRIYQSTLEEDRAILAKIYDAIVGSDDALSELLRSGIRYLLDARFRYDAVINHAFVDCFSLESEIKDIAASEEQAEQAMRLFIATAETLGIYELKHAGEY